MFNPIIDAQKKLFEATAEGGTVQGIKDACAAGQAAWDAATPEQRDEARKNKNAL
jgi:hypothetical protein